MGDDKLNGAAADIGPDLAGLEEIARGLGRGGREGNDIPIAVGAGGSPRSTAGQPDGFNATGNDRIDKSQDGGNDRARRAFGKRVGDAPNRRLPGFRRDGTARRFLPSFPGRGLLRRRATLGRRAPFAGLTPAGTERFFTSSHALLPREKCCRSNHQTTRFVRRDPT
ncbi:MAG TPA: hypothetical protein VFC38_01420 [Stellaceae bacterium]|nr:hypothetical protein [Stellaceae bacterium]